MNYDLMTREKYYWTKNVLLGLSLAAVVFMGFKFLMDSIIKKDCVSLVEVNGVREYENTECGK